MDSDRPPETIDDFDRLVTTSPNSSIVWIRFMAFHLDAGDIERARAVAERALKTINFRLVNPSPFCAQDCELNM